MYTVEVIVPHITLEDIRKIEQTYPGITKIHNFRPIETEVTAERIASHAFNVEHATGTEYVYAATATRTQSGNGWNVSMTIAGD